jgi:hypothetical protein
MIQGIGNVERVVLIVFGRTISSLRLPLWLDGQYLAGVMPSSLAAYCEWYSGHSVSQQRQSERLWTLSPT